MTSPRYPQIEVRLASDKPLALIGATREALRRAGVPKPEIRDFSARAFASDDPYGVCCQWVRIVVRAPM
jgi:hypothetical protein